MGQAKLAAACHCGRVTIQLARKPDYVVHCNCSLCSASGFQGIYYSSHELAIAGEFDFYVREDLPKAERFLRILRCANCGVPTHWEPLAEPPHERMGVNARLVDPALLEGVEIRAVDGRSW